ncbi:DUF409 domain protein [Beauveria brongniartii RCEF 3172]|uniref:GPI mannosyltransferase 2 n=1 Tax=Beauveria brongniartii RCEF 3172 TaxID=1081107 RepID=A0A162M553_9HYPO|nr:DUF409 domain protein [Beauveria brongniartii RCEF 3172]
MALKASSPNASRSPSSSSSSPLLTLTLAFIAWKSFLLLLSCGGALVGPDYDTSTSLFFARSSSSSSSATLLARRLTRWDAIYFVHAARGSNDGSSAPVYEQQWAFSPALSLFLRWLASQARRILSLHGNGDDELEALAGIALAHASHAVAVLELHRLTLLLTGGDARRALLAALLCVISPAGVFLSAPYAESPFAALSFAGVGLLFAVEALRAAGAFVKAPGRVSLAVAAAGVGGVLVAMGSAIPQYVAYTIYCGGGSGGGEERAAVVRPPWCERTVPSIYSYVQDVYWNVGFLRYWTPNQIPLFLLAAPVLTLLIASGYEVLRRPAAWGLAPSSPDHRVLVQALAASQAIVALLALTSYHVQVISRLASGYAVWYWWIAACLMDKSRRGVGRAAVIFMVMYGGIQAVLFSTFLPPA